MVLRMRHCKKQITGVRSRFVARRHPLDTAIQNRELKQIRHILEAALPAKEHPWYERALQIFQKVLTYVGIPSAILASIIPVTSFFNNYIEQINQEFIESRYLEYAKLLYDEGRITRSGKIISIIENKKSLNTKTQYFTAQLAGEAARRGGSNLDSAIDAISILILLNQDPPIFFPDAATEQELVELYLALIDVELENGKHHRVAKRINDLKSVVSEKGINESQREVALRLAHLAVLEHRYNDAEGILHQLVDTEQPNTLKFGEIKFLYGKLYMFQHRYADAIQEIEKSIAIFRAHGDEYNLLRSYNNLGFSYHAKRDYEKAYNYYEISLSISERLNLKRAIARAKLNISVLEKVRGHFGRAKELSLLALSDFKEEGNNLGVIAAANNLISIYRDDGELESALKYANIAFEASKITSDVRGIASSAGHIGDLKRQLNVDHETVFYNLLSYVMYRHTNNPRKTSVVKGILHTIKDRIGQDRFALDLSASIEKAQLLLDEIGRDDISLDNLRF
ncbi:MAG: tetratricopeptide repeat protein [Kiloniellaceae bacterium]